MLCSRSNALLSSLPHSAISAGRGKYLIPLRRELDTPTLPLDLQVKRGWGVCSIL